MDLRLAGILNQAIPLRAVQQLELLHHQAAEIRAEKVVALTARGATPEVQEKEVTDIIQ